MSKDAMSATLHGQAQQPRCSSYPPNWPDHQVPSARPPGRSSAMPRCVSPPTADRAPVIHGGAAGESRSRSPDAKSPLPESNTAHSAVIVMAAML